MNFIYPKLPAVKINSFFRIGGSGLANCLFVYAKAIVASHKYNVPMIAPTWFNLSIGTYIRCQTDKRHYLGLFNSRHEITGIRKALLLSTKSKSCRIQDNPDILVIDGIYDFFKPLLGYHSLINDYLLGHIKTQLLEPLNNFDFKRCAAVHVRLGDFPQNRRVPISWYKSQIIEHPEVEKFLLFSDGTDDELEDLVILPKVERVFFGGAIQDIIAISRCSYLIGSDSSFSAWGAFLGQVPSVFYRLQFGQILNDKSAQIIEHEYSCSID